VRMKVHEKNVVLLSTCIFYKHKVLTNKSQTGEENDVPWINIISSFSLIRSVKYPVLEKENNKLN